MKRSIFLHFGALAAALCGAGSVAQDRSTQSEPTDGVVQGRSYIEIVHCTAMAPLAGRGADFDPLLRKALEASLDFHRNGPPELIYSDPPSPIEEFGIEAQSGFQVGNILGFSQLALRNEYESYVDAEPEGSQLSRREYMEARFLANRCDEIDITSGG